MRVADQRTQISKTRQANDVLCVASLTFDVVSDFYVIKQKKDVYFGK